MFLVVVICQWLGWLDNMTLKEILEMFANLVDKIREIDAEEA